MSSESATGEKGGLPEDRRAYQRHLAKLKVQMIGSDTMPMNVKTVGLSLGGMHIECDRHHAQLMSPPANDDSKQAARQFTARISVSLSKDEKPKTLTINTDVIDVVEMTPDTYRIGLKFDFFYGKSKAILGDFIQKCEQ